MARLPGKGETSVILTVTVIGSSVAASPGGVVAIVLNTAERGHIGFSVTLASCAALRKEIAVAETFLRQIPGNA
jgi:mannitol-specific phosphotransferase system IIBC component